MMAIKNMRFRFFQNKKRLKIIGLSSLAVLLLLTLGAGAFVYKLDQQMIVKMQQKKMLQPTVFYSRAARWRINDLFPLEEIKKNLAQQLRMRQMGQRLFPGDFVISQGASCREFLIPSEIQSDDFENNQDSAGERDTWSLKAEAAKPQLFEEDQCLRIYWDRGVHRLFQEPWIETLWLSSDLKIKGIYRGDPSQTLDAFVMMPQVVAQYLGEEPILREETALREFPVTCLNAIMAIEDSKFLEHKGVSWLGIVRAGIVNFAKGRKAQGGSTLTQQLIKNYFLTPEKTLKRKALEFIMALLMESRFDKDLILETYLNIIYMGQQGPYQVRGYGAASRYYFQKSVSDLSLAQCSLLAAIVNSPGYYNPFTNPDHASTRRALVLEKMEEQKLITHDERLKAEAEPLPKNENPNLYTTLPYFLQASLNQARKLGLIEHEGHRLYTTMDVHDQEAAQRAVVQNVKRIESENSLVKKVKAQKKIDLESALVSVDIATGGVRAVVGGQSFNKTQFNRVLLAKRQVGSTFKPIVYLTAFDKNELNPDDQILDETFTHKYGKQRWTPENYDKKSYGSVPLYFALKESLNLSAAKLALDVGLNPVIEMARLLGITSELKPVPSLSLGAFELNPLELLQAYLTVARFGHFVEYTFLDYIEDADGKMVWDSSQRKDDARISSVATQILIGILKQTAQTGTARRIQQAGYDKIVAGKTGTTNDYRDSWFVGFTPDLLTIVWTGYDDNTSSSLTGASGSLPAWIAYMKEATRYDAVKDFPWTEEVEKKALPAFHSPFEKAKPSSEDLMVEGQDSVELIFKK